MIDLKSHIRGIPDFPKPGILFYDIGTLLAHGPAWAETIKRLGEIVEQEKPDMLMGIESRGFLVGSALAAQHQLGFAMVRKKGKLPGKIIAHSYALEYGTDTIEMQEGIFEKGQKVLLLDDLLATGGTAAAAISLAEKLGATIQAAAFVIELSFLNGRAKLPVPVHSLVKYDE